MISYYYRNLRQDKLEQIDNFRTSCWIHVEAPNENDLKTLNSEFGLELDLLQDALDPDEIPRIETEGQIVYLYMRYAFRREQTVETQPALLAIGPSFVVSIVRESLPLPERLSPARDLFTTQRAKLLLLILRHLVMTYETNSLYLERQIRAVRARLNVSTIHNRDFIYFVVIEDALNTFLSELVTTNLLLQSLLSGKYGLKFHEEDKDLIEDLVQATKQLNESSRSSLHTIVGLREAYSNIMTNNLNRRVGLLTSLTVVLTFPTIIFSLWGTNVPVPGAQNPHAFSLIAGGTLLTIVGLLYWLYRKRWL